MPIVYLLRHAQSVANVKGILAGQDDSVELSKEGFKQAQALVPYLNSINFSQVYSSPMTRCIQTITPFMVKKSDLKFKVDERIIEMNYGDWSGKKLAKLSKDNKWRSVQTKPSTFTFPGGESFKNMRRRVDQMLSHLAGKKGPVLIVTHGDIIKMMITSCLGLPIDRFQSFVAEPASVTVIGLEKSKSTILQSNYRLADHGIKKFKSNQIGGGDTLTSLRQWWLK